MELFFQFLILVVGLSLLWKSGEHAVRNAIGFSLIYNIDKFTIGFLLFAISTGLPEISSAIVSSIKKVPELSAGDLIGSCFVNISFILGIATLIAKKIEVGDVLRSKLFKTIFLIIIIFIGVSFFPIIGKFVAVLLISIYFGSFFWFQVGIPKKEAAQEVSEIKIEIEKQEIKAFLSPKLDITLRLIGSLLFLIASSWIAVYAATKITVALNIKLSLFGATLIAIGTSFPELSLEIHAIKRKEYALALGDIFGASLLNITFTLGLLILINPKIDLSFTRQILPFITVCLFWVIRRLIQKKPLIGRDGLVFLSTFVLYLGWMAFQFIA